MSEETSAGAAPGKGKALTGMILSILGFICCWFVGAVLLFSPIVAYILVGLSGVGLLLSIMGMKGSKGMGITGAILGGIGLLMGIWAIYAIGGAAGAGADAMDALNSMAH